jgi:glutamate-5-semialdehyde dehydrogenase
MIKKKCQMAREASKTLALASPESKQAALLLIAELLWSKRDEILDANAEDVQNAKASGISGSMLDRLTLDENRIADVVNDLRSVAKLPDPVGETYDESILPNGLRIHKRRVPLGVLAVIYEARPNVTVDITGLALKSGNAVILRGGSETMATNSILVAVIHEALCAFGLPDNVVQFIDSPDRALVAELLKMYEYVDMLIPRGGAALHKFCRENSMIPVITGGIGICHLYVAKSADLAAALSVIQNAKVQRPTVCNALDTVLLDRAVAVQVIPPLVEKLSGDGVTFRMDDGSLAIYGTEDEHVKKASSQDFDQEWLSLILGIKVVAGLDEAIQHISDHSTGHSDGILTEDEDEARQFLQRVDSAAVYVNASTRFTDGAQLGMGAEVAISTQRLHARGPMALKELTTYKWIIEGNYHVRP